ncbi:MAG TPA: hypothetical protein VFG04_00805 [Planctomycetaceae bacterium]|nr:hypothetical protein [Planctomycetaceae bacterium]
MSLLEADRLGATLEEGVERFGVCDPTAGGGSANGLSPVAPRDALAAGACDADSPSNGLGPFPRPVEAVGGAWIGWFHSLLPSASGHEPLLFPGLALGRPGPAKGEGAPNWAGGP